MAALRLLLLNSKNKALCARWDQTCLYNYAAFETNKNTSV